MNNIELVFVPLGGVGEIGMNLGLYGVGPENNREWIMVDCGVTFGGPELPGVDLVLPDISFALQLGDALKAIVITHAHEDHYGALLSLWPQLKVPVWCTPFTAGMLEAKAVYEDNAPDIPISTFNAGNSFTIGSFEIEPIYVTHSIPEPMSLAITTPAGTVIHTGDWKIDSEPTLGHATDEAAFRRIGDKGVLALMCDSTNAMREGVSPSEREVSDSLADLIHQAEGRVAITTFSSNVGRIRSIAQAAEKCGRRVMLIGASIRRVVDVATDLGYFEDIAEFVEEDDYGSIGRSKLVVILTGSQGENRAALAKIAREEHRNIRLVPGDKVIFSSRTIPGNEKAIIDIMNRLTEQGIEIITDDKTLVHVSGHPRRNELKSMYEWTRPQILVPVHGEAAHLVAHAKLGRESGIKEVVSARNGDLVQLYPGPAGIVDQIESGRVFLDGTIIGNEDEIGVTERRKLAYVGHIAVSIVIDRKGQLADDVDIATFGLPIETAQGEDMDDLLYQAAIGAIKSIPPQKRKDEERLSEAVRRSVRNAARLYWGKKPVTVVFVAKV